MPTLTLPPGFPFPGMGTEISPQDTMFDGSHAHYLSVGLSALRIIETAIADTPRRILDLPSGHGRITRLLRARFPTAEITCCDVDHDGARFAARHFGTHAVLSGGDFRGLDLGGPFDLLFVGSLLTHLSELHARQLLDCLVRHMAPNGIIILSSHGAYVADRLVPLAWDYLRSPARARRVLEAYRATGYGYSDYPDSQGYGLSLISRPWIEAALHASPLRLASYAERGWDDHQDIMVLRRAEAAARPPTRRLHQALWSHATRWRPRPSPTGWFEAAYAPAQNAATQADPQDEFDEAWYLAAHPDVAAAVRAGHFSSAFDHFRRYGEREGRPPRLP